MKTNSGEAYFVERRLSALRAGLGVFQIISDENLLDSSSDVLNSISL